MDTNSLARNVVYQRKLCGYSQEQLAEKTSVAVRSIQRIEKGEVRPHLNTLRRLAHALNVDVETLVEFEVPQSEVINKSWLLFFHVAALIGFILPPLNIFAPLFIWLYKRGDNPAYDRHGQAVINFQITFTLLFSFSFAALLTIAPLGFYLFIGVILYGLLILFVNIIAVLKAGKCYYPLTFPFIGRVKPAASSTPVVLFALAFFSASYSLPILAQTKNPSLMTDAQLSLFSAELDALRVEKHIPGLAVAIVQNQELRWSHGYGSSHFDTGDGDPYRSVTPDIPFWIASVTKPFLGLLFLQLDEKGVIHLGNPINAMPGWESYCDRLRTSPIIFGRNLECKKPITLRNVLNHTVNGEPGTAFLYNPIMYSRLSRYLEYAHGNPIAEAERGHNTMARLTQEHILEPVGMHRTTAGQWQEDKKDVFFDMAQGYDYANGRYVKRLRPDRHFTGGAGIVSTVEDLAKLDVAIDTGQIGSPLVRSQLFMPAQSSEGHSLPYAFGWYVQEYQGEQLIWHGGWDEDAGFSALYLKVPGQNLTLILLANSPGMWWGNPLDDAQVEGSLFAQLFFEHFVFSTR